MKYKKWTLDTEKQLSVTDLSSDFRKYFFKKTDVL
ncbi:MAG: hypothetical protein ACI83B_001429 [Sediminicola sp.]|mgnify:CR=1 FL=1|jgi:hypothetical protein